MTEAAAIERLTRQRFEDWKCSCHQGWSKEHFNLKDNGEYAWTSLRDDWTVWQAAYSLGISQRIDRQSVAGQYAQHMDWGQVVANGGPPCFFAEAGKFCGRAKRWPGHGLKASHDFVALHQLLKAEFERGISQERKRCAKKLEESAKNLRGTAKRINQVDAHVVDVLQREAAAIRNPDPTEAND